MSQSEPLPTPDQNKRLTCSEAHPQQDVYHPDGHPLTPHTLLIMVDDMIECQKQNEHE